MKPSYLQRLLILLATTLLSVHFGLNSANAYQDPGARDGGTPSPTPTPKKPTTKGTNSPPDYNPGRGRTVKPPAVSVTQMTVIIPPGCRIWLNDVPVETSLIKDVVLSIDGYKVKTSERSAGVITLKDIRPGPYRLVARKPDFREYVIPVTVTPDSKQNVFTVRLIPSPGKLTVSPSVGGAELDIVSLETNLSLGHYSERMDQVELPPGQYRIVTSKEGYKIATREFRVNPGESVYLEPLLELLPPPPPTPNPTPIGTPMNFTLRRQDKYVLFYLHGSSGDSAKTLGSINVSMNGPAMNTVSGNLNGLPCQIELIKLENIAEALIVEAPSAANSWASIVVRVRLKDENRRPISFAINWRSLANAPAGKLDNRASGFVPAQAIRKVQPEYPAAARSSQGTGSVLIQVTIDAEGSVIATKVVEGPDVFRRVAEEAARKWKFRPATRDGQAIESEQIIQFRFTR
jgi:TonB family protein